MKRWNLFFLVVLVVFPIFASSVNGFGVATPYFPNDTVLLEPGQTFEYTIKVQNNEEVSFDINLTYESEGDVAYLNATDFFIKKKSYDTPFTFIITIPDVSTIGKVYTLSYAVRPLMNNSGQVPMSVEIRRSANFMVVSEGGQGHFIVIPSFKDRMLTAFLTIARGSYIYILGLLVLLAVLYVGFRLWRLSRQISDKTSTKAPYTISEAKSTHDIRSLIAMMSEGQFDNEFIRKKYAERFKELNEEFLSKKVMTTSRKEMLKILK